MLADLAEQLKFAPRQAARRHVERAEALLATIDPAGVYPDEWLVMQVTGFRPDSAAPTGELVPGGAIIADLGALVERLCVPAHYQVTEHRPPAWVSIEQVCTRWGVSRRTLERYRRRGLPGRLVEGGVVFALSRVEDFERIHGGELKLRLGGAERAKPARRAAAAMPAHSGALPGEATAGGEATLPMPRMKGRQRERLCFRALRFGLSPAKLARQLNTTPVSIQRAARRWLATQLRWAVVPGPMPEAPLAAATAQMLATALDQPYVNVGLGEPVATSLAAHIDATFAAGWPDANVEYQRAVAMGVLLHRARRGLGVINLSDAPAAALDAIVTDLLWAARLKAELVRAQQLQLLKTIESLTLMPIAGVAQQTLAGCYAVANAALIDATDRFDPFKGGRLNAPASLAMNRAVSKLLASLNATPAASTRPTAPASTPMRATRIEQHDGGGALTGGARAFADWSRAVWPWQWMLEPSAPSIGVYRGAAGLSDDARSLLAERYGWGAYGGYAPTSVAMLASRRQELVHITTRAIAKAERESARAWEAFK